MTEHEYIESLLSALDKANESLLVEQRTNAKLKKENRHLSRIIKKYKDELGLNRKKRKERKFIMS